MSDSAQENPEESQESEDEKNLRVEHERKLVAWRENDMTQAIAGELALQQDRALRNLISSASVSSDPNVARPANEYLAITKLLKNMRNPKDG